jgi:polyisoprenoid-binding protein YceI
MKLSPLFAMAASGAAFSSLPAVAEAAKYAIDADHSTAQFAVKHMMVSTVRGEFRKLAGTVEIDDRNLAHSSVEASIDAATIDTGVDKRDEHLRSADFFDVAKFPKITFKSTEVKKAGRDQYKVAGDLTLHGVTKRVVLDVEAPATEIKDPYGNVKRGAVATTTLNRKDFGLNWNVALEAGGVLVSEAVKITLDLQLVRKDGTTTAGR